MRFAGWEEGGEVTRLFRRCWVYLEEWRPEGYRVFKALEDVVVYLEL